MEILPFYSQYIFFRLLYVVNKKHIFTKNIEVHNNDVRSANIFHLPFANLTKYQKQLIMLESKHLIISQQIHTVGAEWNTNF